jgi:hypothetical protein
MYPSSDDYVSIMLPAFARATCALQYHGSFVDDTTYHMTTTLFLSRGVEFV